MRSAYGSTRNVAGSGTSVDVREARHLVDAEAAARGERRREHAVGRVEAVDRAREVGAVLERRDECVAGEVLGPRDPVLVDHDQPDRAQARVSDLPCDLRGGVALSVAVEAVGRDEPRRPHSQAGASAGELVRHARLSFR